MYWWQYLSLEQVSQVTRSIEGYLLVNLGDHPGDIGTVQFREFCFGERLKCRRLIMNCDGSQESFLRSGENRIIRLWFVGFVEANDVNQ